MRLLFAALMFTLFSQSAWAEAKSLDENFMKGGYEIWTVCVDGYKFVVVNRVAFGNRNKGAPNLSIVQFYEEKDDVAVPAKC